MEIRSILYAAQGNSAAAICAECGGRVLRGDEGALTLRRIPALSAPLSRGLYMREGKIAILQRRAIYPK